MYLAMPERSEKQKHRQNQTNYMLKCYDPDVISGPKESETQDKSLGGCYICPQELRQKCLYFISVRTSHWPF